MRFNSASYLIILLWAAMLCPHQVRAGDYLFEIPALSGVYFQDGIVD